MPERRPTVGLHDAMPPVRSLVPSERDVVTGRLVDLDREDKGSRRRSRRDEPEPEPAASAAPLPRGRFPRWAVVAAGAALVVVIVGGVAVATGGLGGSADGSAAAPEQDQSGSAVDDVPPALDPENLVAYEATLKRTAVEVAPGVEIPADEVVGSVDTATWPCEAGRCTADASAWICAANGCADEPWVFDAAAATWEQTGLAFSAGDGSDLPCFPVTIRLALVRGEDGSYTGTLTQDPVQVYGEVRDGTTVSRCVAPRIADVVTLTPVLATS